MLSSNERMEGSVAPLYVKLGLHQHYKGGFYVVLHIAQNRTRGKRGQYSVVYTSCQTGAMLVCDIEEFTEPVKWDDGKINRRFVHVGV